MPSERTILRVCETCRLGFLATVTQVKLGHARFCRRLCWRAQFDTFERRFWSKVDKRGPVPAHVPELGHCWVWLAATDWRHYGVIGTTASGVRRSARAHRVSYQLAHGVVLTPHEYILHLCDNPPCVRPSHLKAGSQA